MIAHPFSILALSKASPNERIVLNGSHKRLVGEIEKGIALSNSVTEFARKADMNNSHINQIMRGTIKNVTAGTFDRIARGCGLSRQGLGMRVFGAWGAESALRAPKCTFNHEKSASEHVEPEGQPDAQRLIDQLTATLDNLGVSLSVTQPLTLHIGGKAVVIEATDAQHVPLVLECGGVRMTIAADIGASSDTKERLDASTRANSPGQRLPEDARADHRVGTHRS